MVVGEREDEAVDELFDALADGREQLVRTEVGAVGPGRQVLGELEATWRSRVDRMSDLLASGTG